MFDTASAAAAVLEGQNVYCVVNTQPLVYEVREGIVTSVTLAPSVRCLVSFGGVLQHPDPADVYLDADAALLAAQERTASAQSEAAITSEALVQAFSILSEGSTKSLADLAVDVQSAAPAPVVEPPAWGGE